MSVIERGRARCSVPWAAFGEIIETLETPHHLFSWHSSSTAAHYNLVRILKQPRVTGEYSQPLLKRELLVAMIPTRYSNPTTDIEWSWGPVLWVL